MRGRPEKLAASTVRGVTYPILRFGSARLLLPIMLSRLDDDAPKGRSMVYVAVDDADAHHDQATAAGAEITQPLTDQPYGSREYGASDPEGNRWYFGTYSP